MKIRIDFSEKIQLTDVKQKFKFLVV